jgi:inhibitor of cysteine peptidase
MGSRQCGFIRIWLLASALTLSIVGAGAVRAQPRTVAITESQNGTTTTIAKDQSLEIRLPALAGTGYSWALAANPTAPLKLTRSDTLAASDRPGGPQTQLFVLQPTNTGAADVVINYSRPWEKDKPPARTFTLHVVVR